MGLETCTTDHYAPENALRLARVAFEIFPGRAFEELNFNSIEKKEFSPWGPLFPCLTGRALKGPYAAYDRQTIKNENGSASREKIYLSTKSFERTEFWERNSDHQELFRLFKFCRAQADDLCRKHGLPVNTEDQLMLIRYSTSAETLQDREALAKLGSNIFGVNHCDETYFSFHLGESIKELVCWDMKHQRWEHSRTRERELQILFGDFSAIYGVTPNSHRLLSQERWASPERFSVFFERAPQNREPLVREEKNVTHFTTTAFLIDDSSSSKASTGTFDALKNLFSTGAVFYAQDFANPFGELFAQGFQDIFVIKNGLIPKTTGLFIRLLNASRAYPGHLLHHLPFPHNESLFLAHLTSSSALAIDRTLKTGGWPSLRTEIPSYFDSHLDDKEINFETA